MKTFLAVLTAGSLTLAGCGGSSTAMTMTEPAAVSAPRVVASNAADVNPLGVGDRVPAALVRDVAGNEVALSQKIAGAPSVLVFYRGGWCPYCTRQLAGLSRIQEDLTRRGVTLYALSPDLPERLGEAAKEGPLPYELLSDASRAAMTAMGIAFRVDDATNTRLQGYGIQLDEWSGDDQRVLPVPAVFVADANGVIRFVHYDPDYTKRIDGAAVLAALDALSGE